jgi:hypothetical protein
MSSERNFKVYDSRVGINRENVIHVKNFARVVEVGLLELEIGKTISQLDLIREVSQRKLYLLIRGLVYGMCIASGFR